MCFLLFAVDAHPRYPLIIAANRDEYHLRLTRPAMFWPEANYELLAGKDLQAGGTWLGINRDGRVAALTNFWGPPQTGVNISSRGSLVTDFLRARTEPAQYVEHLRVTRTHYNSFNLVFGDTRQLYYVSNRTDDVDSVIPHGIHGLSNVCLNAPWPKVVVGTRRLSNLLANSVDLHASELFDSLLDKSVNPLPARDDNDAGVRTCGFIIGERYGTRSSTVILVDHERHVEFEERSFDSRGLPIRHEHYQFVLNS